MAEIVNLNRLRKARARSEAKLQADRNAVKFGESRGQREAREARDAQQKSRLEQHRREGGPEAQVTKD